MGKKIELIIEKVCFVITVLFALSLLVILCLCFRHELKIFMYPKTIAYYSSTSNDVKHIRDDYYYDDDHDYQDRDEFTHYYTYTIEGKNYSYEKKSSDKYPKEEIVIHYNPNNLYEASEGNIILLVIYSIILLLFIFGICLFIFSKEKNSKKEIQIKDNVKKKSRKK